MANEDDRRTYVFSRDAVGRGIASLVSRQIHEHFSGYLAVLRARRASGVGPATSSDITQFHDRYLKADGGPPKRPFVRPFKSRGKGLAAFNPNVAGSYSPASIRGGKTLSGVLDVKGTGSSARYGLQSKHADSAFTEMLEGKRVSALALAVFLYRDYGFLLAEPRLASVVTLFRDEFGLRSEVPDEAATFDRLFEDSSSGFSDEDLESLEPGAA